MSFTGVVVGARSHCLVLLQKPLQPVLTAEGYDDMDTPEGQLSAFFIKHNPEKLKEVAGGGERQGACSRGHPAVNEHPRCMQHAIEVPPMPRGSCCVEDGATVRLPSAAPPRR